MTQHVLSTARTTFNSVIALFEPTKSTIHWGQSSQSRSQSSWNSPSSGESNVATFSFSSVIISSAFTTDLSDHWLGLILTNFNTIHLFTSFHCPPHVWCGHPQVLHPATPLYVPFKHHSLHSEKYPNGFLCDATIERTQTFNHHQQTKYSLVTCGCDQLCRWCSIFCNLEIFINWKRYYINRDSFSRTGIGWEQ